MTPRERRNLASLVLVLGVIAGIVAIPGAPPVLETGATPAPSEGWTTDVARYREGIVGGWSSLTPISVRTPADRQLVGLVFSGLVSLGPGQELSPGLASSWTSGDDGKRWEFTLDPTARWHDGVPVTASDVVFTFEVLRDPTYVERYGASWQEVKVSAPDPATVIFELATPLGGFPQALTQGILPKHLLGGLSVDEIQSGAFATAPVGTGPFRLVSIDASSAELVRVSGEDSAGSGAASGGGAGGDRPIDEFEMRFYQDVPDLLAAFRAGEVDGIVGLGPDEVADAGGPTGTVRYRYPTSTLTVVVPNERGTSAFKSRLVREALTIAIDRESLVEGVMGDEAIRADGLIPPSSWAFHGASSPRIAFDLSTASGRLREAGWKRAKETTAGTGGWIPKGRKEPLTLRIVTPNATTNPSTFAAAEHVAEDWRALGFGVEIEGVERDELATRLQTGDFMFAVVGMNIGLDPDLYPFLASSQVRADGSNVAGVQIADLDELLTEARKAGTPAQRRARYRALQAYLSKTSILFPLYFANQTVITSGRLTGLRMREISTLGDRYWDVLTWRLADGR